MMRIVKSIKQLTAVYNDKVWKRWIVPDPEPNVPFSGFVTAIFLSKSIKLAIPINNEVKAMLNKIVILVFSGCRRLAPFQESL